MGLALRLLLTRQTYTMCLAMRSLDLSTAGFVASVAEMEMEDFLGERKRGRDRNGKFYQRKRKRQIQMGRKETQNEEGIYPSEMIGEPGGGDVQREREREKNRICTYVQRECETICAVWEECLKSNVGKLMVWKIEKGPSLTFAGCRKKVRSCGEEGGFRQQYY